jgi:hypothetical protein
MFDKKFKNFVSFAVQKSKEYYSNELNLNTASPYFIGFGNPNSEILIMGKEKGFCEKNSEQLQYESIENHLAPVLAIAGTGVHHSTVSVRRSGANK